MELLGAANLAPSATNRQPWEFVVVHRSYLDRLDQVLREAFTRAGGQCKRRYHAAGNQGPVNSRG